MLYADPLLAFPLTHWETLLLSSTLSFKVTASDRVWTPSFSSKGQVRCPPLVQHLLKGSRTLSWPVLLQWTAGHWIDHLPLNPSTWGRLIHMDSRKREVTVKFRTMQPGSLRRSFSLGLGFLISSSVLRTYSQSPLFLQCSPSISYLSQH